MKCINKLIDDQYELKSITHTRYIARAILLNDKNEVCLIHLLGDDIFGHRNYYETPGGGINENESPIEAVIREIQEETGFKSEVISEIGYVDDYYNLINRHNINYYYLLKITGKANKHLDEFEEKMFKEMIFVDINKAIELFENMNKEKIEILVKNRELPILKIVKKILEEK